MRMLLIFFLLLATTFSGSPAFAQQTMDASLLLPSVSIRFSPSSGTFVAGSTFEVPVVLDTKGASVNTVAVVVHFDSDKLSVVRPSSDQSIVGLWLEPPSYDNTHGTAKYVGAIPNGIVTNAGVIGTLTFKAKITGSATLSIRNDSEALLNDGLGSQARIEGGRATYSIIPKPPEGLRVFSDTHPSQETWYNNKSPVFYWESYPGTTGYSYVLDNKPSTIPESTILSTEAVRAYQDLEDGLWYFHVKALVNGGWSPTGHHLVRIDTTPPAEFKPEVNYLLAAPVVVERALVSFFTTDNLSGIARYEVGVIDKTAPVSESPLFEETQSPYQVSTVTAAGSRVIVRAIDNAGNVRDESINVTSPTLFMNLLQKYSLYLLGGALVLIILGSILHYLYGHHVIAHLKRAFELVRREEEAEKAREPLEGPQ